MTKNSIRNSEDIEMFQLINPFYGRTGRGRWWLLQLIIFLLALIGLFLTAAFIATPNAPSEVRNANEDISLMLIIVFVLFANFSTCLNRLRDTGRSGFWYITFLLPGVGSGLMMYFCGIESSKISHY